MFIKRKIEVHITLFSGTFRGGNTKIIRDLAVDVTIKKPGLPEANSCEISIYNMLAEDMEHISMLAFEPLQAPVNKVAVYAGDDAGGLSLAFKGDILPGGATADYNRAPDIVFNISAATGYSQSVAPAPPTSVNGRGGLKSLISRLSSTAGMTFSSQGEDVMLSSPYLSGSPIKQMQDAARAAGMGLYIDDDEVVLLSGGATRQGNTLMPEGKAPLINKDSGLIGYPSFSQTGIDFKCIYNPQLKHGGLVRVESIVPRATGNWQIICLTHNLAANIPNGAWESEVKTAYTR